jgi:hypothetical protein
MFFPESVSSLNLTEFSTLLKLFDEDMNMKIEKKEIWNTFQNNKISMSKPFIPKITEALETLNF